MAGCHWGANKKVMPTSATAARTRSGSAPKFTPRASSTSAEPTLPEAERLPCLTTGIPAALTTKATAVEMLKVPAPSPPVPQVSTRRGKSSGDPSEARCSTRAMPASSPALTPLACRAARIAPDTTSGTWFWSQPFINCSAWASLRDCRSSNCPKSCGQRSAVSVMGRDPGCQRVLIVAYPASGSLASCRSGHADGWYSGFDLSRFRP